MRQHNVRFVCECAHTPKVIKMHGETVKKEMCTVAIDVHVAA